MLPIPLLARMEAEPLLATIGNTPLVRLEKISAELPGIEILAKAEYFNPGGSVKDRAACAIGTRARDANVRRTEAANSGGSCCCSIAGSAVTRTDFGL